MNYIYHLKPEPFFGKHLIPLNEMDRNGELYRGHASKYIGREALTKQEIPILNCKWNDVVQFSALHPQLIINELRKIVPDLKIHRLKCFKISVQEIEDAYEAVIFDRIKGRDSFSISSEEIQKFCASTYVELDSVPVETINFWKGVKTNGGKYLWFAYIPHIFLKGSVDTSNFEIIDLK